MSKQRPRNPRYWPRMKVRGARRRALEPWQRMAGSFDRFGHALIQFGVDSQQVGRVLTFKLKDLEDHAEH